ncbi:MAG: trypsin-like peptidase domain-containing protein [Gemmatimonadaceae bacterium]
MPIELRILGGARAGQTKTFEKSNISLGRHPASDLAFDVSRDLDVSTKHGEIREAAGGYEIFDLNSTNGTYVNGERVTPGGSRVLRTGDTIGFGAHGPTVSVDIAGQPAVAPRTSVAGARHASPPAARPAVAARAATSSRQVSGTGERIAIAVKHQTRMLRYGVIGAVVILGGIAGGAVWMEHRDAATREAQIKQYVAANEELSKSFQTKLLSMNDTSVTNSWKRRADSLSSNARDAKTDSERAVALAALRQEGEFRKKVSTGDWSTIHAANDNAIVLINAEIGSGAQEATGFTVAPSGLIVTNKHVVEDSATGTRASKVHIKFANSRTWNAAHVVRVAGKGVDIALVQLDEGGRYPTVTLAPSVDAPVGSPIMSIGFPDGTSLPMDGTGNDLVAKTTLTLGTISKVISGLLQVDSYATHGSSGSPVFDTHGHVIGAVWGGIDGRIVFAVPAEKIAELVKGAK